MELGFIGGKIKGFIKGNGSKLICRDMDFINGLMEGNIWGNLLWIRKKDMEYIIGKMEGSTVDIGSEENSMDLAYILYHLRIERDMAYGKRVKE